MEFHQKFNVRVAPRVAERLKDTLKAFDDFKSKQKTYEVVIFDM